MDPPTTTTLPSYLANLSPHTWYDYTTTPALALEFTSPATFKPSKPKPPIQLYPNDILTLANLLPSTRPLLLSPKFLKALDLTPEETASLTKALKEHPPSSSEKLGGGGGLASGKRKSKLEELREREQQLAKEETRAEAKAEKAKEVKRRREIDQALGLIGKGKRKPITYGKKPETTTTTSTTTATDSDEVQQQQDQGEQECEEAEQETAEQRKRRKIQELDRQLGLLPAGDDLPERIAPGGTDIPESVDTEHAQSSRIDTDEAAAIRRAGIDILLGLVGDNGNPGNEYVSQSEKENDLIHKAEVTQRRIDAEMGCLNSERIAQMDAILGLLSLKKTSAVEEYRA